MFSFLFRNMVGRLFLETLKSVADNPHDVATVMWILYNMSENEGVYLSSVEQKT